MVRYEYKYEESVVSENSKAMDFIADLTPEVAERVLNDLGKAKWKLVSSTQRNGTTIA
ncbi:MAG: hypothetical protein ACXAB7_20590 [Candidatus Kariarchaeaceae archaeon]|jgi:hypothetical protein